MSVIAPDVSYYQKPVDDTFNRRWLIFRCCDGDFVDPNAAHNAAWSRRAKAAGRLDGWVVYVVYRPGLNNVVLNHLDALGVTGAYVMIDVESWQGQIVGNHSVEINSLADAVAGRVGQSRVWVYANRGDFDSIYPNRLPWVRLVVAGYDSVQPVMPNMIGWQYTNGVENHTSYPASTPPFGACDHNILFIGESGLGGGTEIPQPSTPLEDDLSAAAEAVIAELGKRLDDFDVMKSAVLGTHDAVGSIAARVVSVQTKTDIIGSATTSIQAAVGDMRPKVTQIAAAVPGVASNAYGAYHAALQLLDAAAAGTAPAPADAAALAAAMRAELARTPLQIAGTAK